MGCCNNEGHCRKCDGFFWSLIGVLMLINLLVWPKWLGIDGWLGFAAILLMLCGVWRTLAYACTCQKDCSKDSCCKETPTEPAKEASVEVAKVAHKESKKKK